MTKDASEFGSRMIAIAAVLDRSLEVRRFDRDGEPQSATIAHGLLDIESSLRVIADQYLPLLEKGQLTDEQLSDVLRDIGSELEHVLYHINDMNFYRYISDVKHE